MPSMERNGSRGVVESGELYEDSTKELGVPGDRVATELGNERNRDGAPGGVSGS